MNGDAPAIASASAGTKSSIPPKIVEQKLVRKNELKAKSTLLLAIPDEHLLKFHGIKDAKTLWEAIKSRFGGNKESKKMQKTIMKQQYENFAASRSVGLDKTYDRFQKLISQLEIHGEVISQEDANLKLLRSLPSAWNNIALIIRNKSDLDTSSTNEAVNTAHEVSTASSQGQASSSTYANDVMFSFFANQSNSPQLDNEDLEQIDTDDLEEMDLKWQKLLALIRQRLNVITAIGEGHFARECKAPRNQGYRNGDNPRRVVQVETPANALVFQDGIDCLKSYETLQKQYDQQRKAPKKSNLEIIGYQMGLESLEARIVIHEKNEAIYEEDIAFLKYDVQVKDISIKNFKNQLEEALKEKDDLKLKLEKFEESSKNLTKLINSQISAKDTAGLGYDCQINKSEVVHSVFNNRESDVDDSPINDIFKIGKGFHAVPPPYTGNYMPSRPDLSFAGLDDSVYMTKVSETETSVSKTSKDIVEKHKTFRPSAPIIEDWYTNSDNDSVFRPKPDQTKPKITKINFVKSDENLKSVNKENTNRQEEYPRKSQSPRDNRRNWNGMMTQKLGNGFEFIKKACFICGSFNRLIKDCDFHDKKMVEKPVLNNKGRVTGQREIRLDKYQLILLSKALQEQQHQLVLPGLLVLPVSTAAPKSKVNDTLPKTYSYFKAHLPVRRAFNQKLAAKTNNLNKKVKTARVNIVTTDGSKAVVHAAVGNGENAVKSSACWIWRPTRNVIDHTSKDSGSYMLKRFDYVDLQGRLKSVMAWVPSMNYEPVTVGNQTNKHAGNKDNDTQQYILLPLLYNSPQSSKDAVADDAGKKTNEEPAHEGKRNGQEKVRGASNKEDDQNVHDFRAELDNLLVHQKEGYANSTNRESTVSLSVSTADGAYDDEDVDAEADLNNLEITMNVSPILTTRIHKDHPKDQIIGDIYSATQTRRMTKITEEHAMVWTLVDLPKGKRAIGTKWVYRNKKDERGIVVRNKARLVAQGYTQEEGIDMMSVFLYGTIEEEVYVCQPPGFEDPQFPDKVYKLEKALYGLHQAPKAWYETLSTYLLENGFRRGTIDKTLFIKKEKGDILLVQVYVNDIIFGSTKNSLCVECEQMMHKKFQMSSMGELTFFLGLQVMQKDDGIFIIQDKYVADLLKKFDFVTIKTASTPIETNKALLKDEEVEDVDERIFKKKPKTTKPSTGWKRQSQSEAKGSESTRPSKRMKRFLRRPPYADDASPTAQSPNYVPESGPEADPEEDDNEDPEEDPADGGDDAMTYLLHHYHSPPPLHVVITNTPPSPIRSLAIDFLFSSPPLLLPSASRREDRPEVKSYLTSKRLGRSAEPERAVGYGITTRVMRKLRTLRGNPLVSDTDWTDEQNAYTHHPYGGKAGSRLVPKLWRRTMDRVICPGEVMSAVHSILIIFKIRELHDADRRREAVTSEMLKADHRRSAEMRYPTGTCGSITGTGHSTIEGDNKGPAGGPAQLDAARGGCHDAAYAMTWANLRKKMTDKYCLRNEMKKLEAKLWNLKVKIPSCVMKRERKAKNNLLMAIVPRSIWKIHGMMRQKRSGNQIRTSKSSTNKVKSSFTGAYSTCTPSTSSTNISEKEILADFADEVIYSLFAKQSEDWDLLHEDMNKLREMNLDI
ncbi:ribonuclease H-like domain-containing protein [Tanacetum coccineum]